MATASTLSAGPQGAMYRRAGLDALVKLDPRKLAGNPVILATEVVAVLATVSTIDALIHHGAIGFTLQIAIWLWATVLFANFAESVAEGRGKAAADSLRAARVTTKAKLLSDNGGLGAVVMTASNDLKMGDIILVEAGDVIPADGEIIEGVASVNESAITGESAPVIRESGGDRSAVTGGTTLVSDFLKIRVTSGPGSSFLDRMIAMVEGANRRKTPNEVALAVLLAGLTLVFLIAVVTLLGLGAYSKVNLDPIVLGALFICLIPTTIGGLLSAVGIAGMDRLLKVNVLATSGRAVEAAGDCDTLLLDKTGTITFGNRMATEVIAAPGVPDVRALASGGDVVPVRRNRRGPLDPRIGARKTRHDRDPAGRRDLDPLQRHHPPVRRRRRRRTAGARVRSTRSTAWSASAPTRSPRKSPPPWTASRARAVRPWPSPRTSS